MAERDLQAEYSRIVKQIDQIKTQIVQVKAQIDADRPREAELLDELKQRYGVESFEEADKVIAQLRDHTVKGLDEISTILQNLYQPTVGVVAPVAVTQITPQAGALTLDALIRAGAR